MVLANTLGFGLDKFFHYMEMGGYVMPPLFAANLLLWYAVGYRAAALKRGNVQSVRTLIDRQLKSSSPGESIVENAVIQGIALYRKGRPQLRRLLDDVFGDYTRDLNRFAALIRSVVVISPLLGLLGTVSGMIETFDSLNEMALFTQSGGIAAGISQALFTTQLGLAVAIPGLLLKGHLDRKQHTIEMELAQIKDILCGLRQEETAVEAEA